ncbi:MAG TPA: carbohydrate-binding domain-containing protein [Candidatus Gallacutalibacter stercoravium]|nr:carbohydrate-binding domain-containing protein [Candidatus Gallacutalibacter stercoravium]
MKKQNHPAGFILRLAAVLLIAVYLAAALSACGGDPAGQTPTEQTGQSEQSGQGETSAADETQLAVGDYDLTFTARDLDVGYEESEATVITLQGQSATVSGEGAAVSGGEVTISAEGSYVLTGELSEGRIVVNAGEADKVQLVFNNASLHCSTSAPVYIKQADKVFITLAEGSKNTLTDGESYDLTGEEDNIDGVIFSKADLTINGAGALAITGSYKHGIVSKDDLVITGGSFTITANGQGLSGKDCVKINDGSFVINTQADAVQSDNAEDASRGFVYIAGGDFTIDAQGDGIQAETALIISGGSFAVTTGGGSANASTQADGSFNPDWGNWGGGPGQTAQAEDTEETASAKGLKAGVLLQVSGGRLQIDSSDDSVHSNGAATLSGGQITISSGDDGIHADGALRLEGTGVIIEKSYEGLEGANITITGGEIAVTASDDGLNAAGGNDASSQGDRPGQNNFAANSEYFISIEGGSLTVDASGDGIDSNGGFYVSGGETYVAGSTNSGNGTLDYASEAQITGGVFVAAGSAGMAQGFGESSTQCSIFYDLSSTVQDGSQLVLTDAAGNEVLCFTPQKAYQSLVLSAPALTQGESYTLSAGGQSQEITLTGVVTSNTSGGMGEVPGGGMEGMGGMGNQPGGGRR